MPSISSLSADVTLIGFFLGVPTILATYYQAYKARHEADLSRQGLVYSQNCLEFVLDDGTTVNVVPLETLHTLPKPEEIILLPGAGFAAAETTGGAFRVLRVEHIYTRVDLNPLLTHQARLAKVVAHVRQVIY